LRQVCPGRIREHLEPVSTKHSREHVRRGRLAVRAQHVHDAVPELSGHIFEKAWCQSRSDVAGKRGAAAAQARKTAHELAEGNRQQILQADGLTQGNRAGTGTARGGEASPSSWTQSGGCALE